MSNRTYENIRRIRKDFKLNVIQIQVKKRAYNQLSPLRKLKFRYQTIYNQSLTKIEQRCAHVSSSWWISIDILIHKCDERTMTSHDAIVSNERNITIYTNDNELNEHINSSTIWIVIMNLQWTSLIAQIKKTYLRTTDEFTVYFDELYEIIMVLKMIKEKDNIDRSIYIFIDNQTIIRSSRRLRNQAD